MIGGEQMVDIQHGENRFFIEADGEKLGGNYVCEFW